MSITLHTQTPVISITRPEDTSSACLASSSLRRRRRRKHCALTSKADQRRWVLGTPRGSITCTHVIHATNGYAGHLLPFFKGSSDPQESGITPNINKGQNSSNSFADTLDNFGIAPTRGQVILVPSLIPFSKFPWTSAWSGGGGHWEYFFPRFQHITSPNVQAPFIVLGGGRQHGTNYEGGVSDDSQISRNVGQALRKYLGGLFEGLFATGEDGKDIVEMEWVCPLVFMHKLNNAQQIIDRDNGFY